MRLYVKNGKKNSFKTLVSAHMPSFLLTSEMLFRMWNFLLLISDTDWTAVSIYAQIFVLLKERWPEFSFSHKQNPESFIHSGSSLFCFRWRSVRRKLLSWMTLWNSKITIEFRTNKIYILVIIKCSNFYATFLLELVYFI